MAAAAAAFAVADEVTEAVEQVEGEIEKADAFAEAMEEIVEGEQEEIDVVADEVTEAMEEAGAVANEPEEAMEQAEEEREEADAVADEAEEAMEQAEDEREEADAVGDEAAGSEASLWPSLPLGRVKRIIRVDRDIRKVTSEAALLIAKATELFLGSLAAGAHRAASRRGRRAVRAAHVRAAAREHRPTADFLLDCLPAAADEAPPARAAAAAGPRGGGGGGGEAKPLPRGTRRIDAFFQKAT